MQDPPTLYLLLGKVIEAEVKAETTKKVNPINLNEAMKTAQAQLDKLGTKEWLISIFIPSEITPAYLSFLNSTSSSVSNNRTANTA